MKLSGASLLATSLYLMACNGGSPTPQPAPAPVPAAPQVTESAGMAEASRHSAPRWPGDVAVSLDRGCAAPACRGGSIAIEVTSLRADAVEIDLYLAAAGLDGRSARVRPAGLPEGGLSLAAGERRRFVVEAAAMPVQPIGSLATAWAELSVTAGAETDGSSSSPVAYEHDAGYRSVTLYDDAGALARAARIDPTATAAARPAGRVWTGRALVESAALPANGGVGYTLGGATTTSVPDAALGAPAPLPPGPQPQAGDPPPAGTHVCFDLKVAYHDAAIGEDILAAEPFHGVPAVQLQSASFLRASITKAGVITPIWEGYLNVGGCTGYASLSGAYTLNVWSQLEKLVGGQVVHNDIRLYAGGSSTVQKWSHAFTVSGAPSTVNVEAATWSHTMNVTGVAARVFAASDSWLPPGTHDTIVDRGCPDFTPATDSCVGGSLYIGPGAPPAPAQAKLKFVIGHEYGHLVQDRHFQVNNYSYTGVNDTLGACRCDHVTSANSLHCMQSLERYEAAFLEGWAHFYAAKLYNNRLESDCHFGYYKEVLIPFFVLAPTVPVSCASTVAWRDTYCSAIPNTAVEMDVMRFMWALYSLAPDRFTVEEIGELFHGAQQQAGAPAITWPALQAAAAAIYGPSSAKYAKVVAQAAIHAVD